MNAALSVPPEPAPSGSRIGNSWSGWRWVFYVTLVFVAHLAFVLTFGSRQPIVPRAVTNAPAIQFTTGQSELQTLDDPTLFALPHPRGFAAAWLQRPNIEFEPFRWTEPPQLMALPFTELGATFLRYAQTNVFPQLQLENLPPPAGAGLHLTDQTMALKQRSAVRVKGDLAGRHWLNAPAILRAWPAADLLTNSVVQVLADGDGQILSAALLPPGSGLKAADQRALELARSARFASGARNDGSLTLGTLIFEWLAVPDTNPPPANP